MPAATIRPQKQAGRVYKKAAAKPGKSNAATNRRTEQLTEPPGY